MLDNVQLIVYNKAIKKSKGDNNNERNYKDYRHFWWHRTWHALPSHLHRPHRPPCLRRPLLRLLALFPSSHYLGRTSLGILCDCSACVVDNCNYRLHRRKIGGTPPYFFQKKRIYNIVYSSARAGKYIIYNAK